MVYDAVIQELFGESMIEPSRLLRAAALGAFLLIVGACGQDGKGPPPLASSDAESAEVATAPTGTKLPSFDYPGGWLSESACVDICGVTPESPVERPAAVVCFDPNDADCAAKTGEGDYDYLMLSQHWLPTFCMGLVEGYDTTVTHQEGARCQAETASRLALHGLWPNYRAGFPQCCGSASVLDPQWAHAWPSDLQGRLWQQQPDPTTSGFDAAICQIYNHEWQKHGTCFVDSGSPEEDAKKYFAVGLSLNEQLAAANRQLQEWAGTTQPRENIEALYPQAVQVLCDSHHVDRLLEIHTCWSRELELIDCAATEGFGSLKPCGGELTLPEWMG